MNESNHPPDDDLNEYSEPHSPFQKLIDSQRKLHGLSNRQLAEKIGVSQATLWIWLHNLNGHPQSFNTEHTSRLASVLEMSESQIKAALEASRPLDSFGRFIQLVENDKHETLSKSYILNLARNLCSGGKVTLLMLAAVLILPNAVCGEDPQTFITLKGKHYEKVHVTEVTPLTIAFTHSTGVARLSFTEFGTDVQKKYGYDEAKAGAWLAEQARKAPEAVKAEQARQDVQMRRANELRLQVEDFAQAIRDGAIDPRTGRFYDADAAQRQRAETFRWLQRYGAPRAASQRPSPGETR